MGKPLNGRCSEHAISNMETNTFVQNPELNRIAERIIELCSNRLSQALTDPSPLGLILTGSFSRGEGTILILQQEEKIVLGDAEFLVIFRDGEPLDSLRVRLKHVTMGIEKDLRSDNIECAVEFTPACRSYLRRVPPSIFGTELALHSVVVWGDQRLVLDLPRSNPESIPKIDAFYLICNRIIEQLELLQRLETADQKSLLQNYYQLVKLYLDLAGSILIFLEDYQPTYKLRAEALQSKAIPDGLEYFHDWNAFCLEVRDASQLKVDLNPQSLFDIFGEEAEIQQKREMIINKMQRAAGYVLPIWIWEAVQLIGGATPLPEDEIMRGLLRLGTMKDRLKSWLKWLRLGHLNGNKIPVQSVFLGFLKGNPRMMTYLAAKKLYETVLAKPNVDVSTRVEVAMQRMPFNGSTSVDPLTAIDFLIRTWRTFIRTA
jgi:hypothetical protein